MKHPGIIIVIECKPVQRSPVSFTNASARKLRKAGGRKRPPAKRTGKDGKQLVL
jgi:hypothetical protein